MNPSNTVENVKPASGKSDFYPTFFLCLFLGVFGAHRFYNRKLGTGVLQLVTFGGLGFWWLVDLIMVLLGKFKDKNAVPIQNINPKLSWTVAAVVIVIGIAGGNSETGTSGGNPTAPAADSTTSSSSKSDDVYLCQSPAATLRLAAGKSAGMMINGSAFEGHWSKSGNTIEFRPTTIRVLVVEYQLVASMVLLNLRFVFSK